MATVDGDLADVTVHAADGQPVTLTRITLTGGGTAIKASTAVPGAAVEALIADAVGAQTGSGRRRSRLARRTRSTVSAGATVTGRLHDQRRQPRGPGGRGAAAAGTEVLLSEAVTDVPIRLTSVRVTAAGDCDWAATWPSACWADAGPLAPTR